jgi:hypothetical protein
MKQVHFEINETEERMVGELQEQQHKTLAAIFRDALRLLYKKENILKTSKILAFVLLPIFASLTQGCGSATTMQAGCGGGGGIPCATPTPTPIPTPTPPPPASTFNPFPIGAHWTMISNITGGITYFDVLPQDHFGCETGELINLRISKTNPADYWGAGAPFNVTEQFILLHEPNGGWRALGDFELSESLTLNATTNLLRPAGLTIYPYAITPGTGEENATLDTMYFYKQELGVTFSCVPGEENQPPPPGVGSGHARWVTQFTTDAQGNVHAHFWEYAPSGVNEEIWVFPPSPGIGLIELDQLSNGGQPRSLVLTRQ